MKMKIKIENRHRTRCHPVTLSPSVVKWWHYSHFKVSNKCRDARQVPVDLRLLIRALQHTFVVWFSGLQLRMLCSTYALQAQHAAPRVSPQHLHIKVNDQRRDARRVSVGCSCLCVLCSTLSLYGSPAYNCTCSAAPMHYKHNMPHPVYHPSTCDKRRDARRMPVDLRLLMRALQHPFVVCFSGLEFHVLCSNCFLNNCGYVTLVC
jgi:hypothetical protein